MSKNNTRDSQNAALRKLTKKEVNKEYNKKNIKTAMRAGQADMILCLLISLVGFIVGLFFLYKLFDYTVVAISAFGLDAFAILIYIRNTINKWLKNKKRKSEIKYILKLFTIFFTFTLMGWGAKHFNLDTRLQSAKSAFIHPRPTPKNETASKENTDTKDETNPKESAKLISPKPISAIEQNWLEKQNSDILGPLNYTEVTLADYNQALNLKLSSDNYNLIFFYGNQYKITAWNDEKIILSQVRNLFEDRRKEKNKNLFDAKATQPQKDEIYKISEKEDKADQEYTDLNDKITDMNTRINYYENLPKATLAQLISNDYHLLALLAFYYGYSHDAIIYYYSKSIEYALEYISFEDVADDIVKQKLLWIAARYDDIEFTCKHTTEAEWAPKLSAAFRCLSYEY